MHHCDQELIPALTQFVRSTGDHAREASLQRLTRGMAILDTAWPKNRPSHRFWGGSDAGLIDYCHCTLFQALRQSGCESVSQLVDRFPALAAWDEALRDHVRIQRAEAMLDAL
jgi:hypothetical protein